MKRVLVFLALLALLSTCRERFEAEQVYKPGNILVVEGFINVGPGITRIKLSRVTPLDGVIQQNPEPDGIVVIEDDASTSYTLHHVGNGVYESDELNLGTDHEYRLRVEANDQLFVSDFTEPIISPRIDSVSWTRSADDYITIAVSTHDPLNETFYYKWEYEEIWENRTAFRSSWAYENGIPRARASDEIKAMTICWPRRYNKDLLMATSAAFVTDAISAFPLSKFHITDVRLGWRYSMMVTQRALSADEYEFLQIMKRNTNDLGGFFDAQPSQLLGNIACTTSNEPVVGYIGAYTSQQKQLIIKHNQISDFDYSTPCFFDPLNGYLDDPQLPSYLENAIPLDAIYGPFVDDAAPIIGFTLVPNTCADCRIVFGSEPKPDFWVAEDEEEIE
ncbi:MAG TPA: DUF4249 domain-containing protein [Cyclobacteriaceae bacterium]|nr:DUF4249 domain-containing protein [Cyclobacteriaceae bacterium]HMV09543.1 DUF4249 domain-containing protein [Cyclobacteriaceae bacterium]HMX01994.1 DUF4249 domain-containing protein [Cyclobacteriaceae bacterium]HMX51863.1 DUF4249 domain-containing protein [Cyclobacteriaceae bacterium]HMY94817.1 DUF4249 domain-containing protein [Cyclobacteriaceae bacterium]